MAAESPTPLYFRLVLGLLRPFPDFDFRFIKPIRARAVRLLRLQEGQRVLDVGCGPGGSFPFLRAAVGTTGSVVGVEISPEVSVLAQRRIERHGWSNVQVRIAPAQTVALTQQFDGLHMFAAPDVFGSESALANLLPRLRVGARIVFFGAKTSTGRFGWVLNPFLRLAFPKLTFSTTPVPDAEPWKPLAPQLSDFAVQELFFGWMFLASGTYNPGPSATIPAT
jgi:demethylmenaquinone methyltransferase/2-methoxy-6-polyprenyl-1,4-benzoquinol methylase